MINIEFCKSVTENLAMLQKKFNDALRGPKWSNVKLEELSVEEGEKSRPEL